ncbi:MAG: hypothetical protein ACK4ON_01075 [Bacteroidia bacterium]
MGTEYNFVIFEFVFRVFCGVLFVYQGYDKLFVVGMNEVVNTFQNEARRKNVPRFFVVVSSYYSSLVEFFVGYEICFSSLNIDWHINGNT